MKNYQKLSILGLVLMGASAVTAAILPKPKPAVLASGELQASFDASLNPQFTCKAGDAGTCDNSTAVKASATTQNGQASSVDAITSTGTVNTGLHDVGGVAVSIVR
jgi:hypothetical protein